MGTLHVVATPIGNLEDLTFRALRIFKAVDFVLCEDTRVTRKLLNHYQIATPTLSFHQHSNQVKVDQLISLLDKGKDLALVTDAGTPGLSDPGGVLVAAALAKGHGVITIPGPSALTAASAVAGLALDKFLFLGFLPHKKGRQTLLKEIANSSYPVILYESVHRIEKLIEELRIKNEELGGKEFYLVVARELTKKFETVYRGTVAAVKEKLKKEEIKGEFVVIISRITRVKN